MIATETVFPTSVTWPEGWTTIATPTACLTDARRTVTITASPTSVISPTEPASIAPGTPSRTNAKMIATRTGPPTRATCPWDRVWIATTISSPTNASRSSTWAPPPPRTAAFSWARRCFDSAGFSVASAGDVNADDLPDLLVGAWRADLDGQPVGAAYVVFGGLDSFGSLTLELDDLDGSNGFSSLVWRPSTTRDGVWRAWVTLMATGLATWLWARRGRPHRIQDEPAGYIVFGGPFVGSDGKVEVSDLDGKAGFVFAGAAENDFVGVSVAGSGDLNDDGFDDVAIAHWSDPNGSYSGSSYVVFGSPDAGTGGQLSAANLDGSNGFEIRGSSVNDQLGISAQFIGDINADGLDDLAVGANQADLNGPGNGAVYVLFGGEDVGLSGVVDAAALDGVLGFAFAGADGDGVGWSVAGGDFNADGIADLLVGNDTALGTVVGYLIWGGSEIGADGLLIAEDLDGENGTAFLSQQGFRLRVGTAADYNMDGLNDILLGAEAAVVDESTPGGSLPALRATRAGWKCNHRPGNSESTMGFRFVGDRSGDAAGSGVSGTGDVNGDGAADMLIGARGYDGASTKLGHAYLMFGLRGLQP